MNPNSCAHPPEHQAVTTNNSLREIQHTCELCGHIEVQILGIVYRKLPTIEEPLYVD